jgi:hypothetical protein
MVVFYSKKEVEKVVNRPMIALGESNGSSIRV